MGVLLDFLLGFIIGRAIKSLCKVCNRTEAVYGVYCQPCLDAETENMTDEDLNVGGKAN